ncbi:hypothetical protein CYMTET_5503 [Cymbomonas tetramitiformis]|uniref:ubiquitinyl hydrolase 1 n=1 Tax=Cymbomonas tetramitiformis TaxID=36881 RepID=A0AAE0LJ05_9CHLO|nr:hypothetical protein CYMTET_5503 [Cymbomonas tetramitiformis]
MLKRKIVDGYCPRCFQKATLRCAKCRRVSYCCKGHQVQDWDMGHKAICGLTLPIAVPSQRPDKQSGVPIISDPEWNEVVSSPLHRPPYRGLLNTGNSCFLNATLQCLLRDPTVCSYWLQDSPPGVGSPKRRRQTTASRRSVLRLSKALAGGLWRCGTSALHLGIRAVALTLLRLWLEGCGAVALVAALAAPLQCGDAGWGTGWGASSASPSSTAMLAPTLPAAALLLQMMQQPGAAAVSPYELTRWLPKIGDEFMWGAQEDAHEFLRATLRALTHEQVRHTSSGGAAPDEQTSFAGRAFGGWLQSQIQCLECAHASSTYESIQDLSLDIMNCTETVEEMLELFTAPERLDKANKYTCGGCEKKVRGLKQLSIHEAPPSLVLHLKRFRMGFYGKIGHHIRFSSELNLRPYMSALAGEGSAMYVLTGVLVHLDNFNTTHYGHYIAYVRSRLPGGVSRGDSQSSAPATSSAGAAHQWYRMDDSDATPVTEQEVLAAPAYLLFYSCDTAAAAAAPQGGGGSSSMQGGGPTPPMSRSGSREGGLGSLARSGSQEGLSSTSSANGSDAPVLCTGGCGYYGTAAAGGLCSKCYTDLHGERPPTAPQPAAEPTSSGDKAGFAQPSSQSELLSASLKELSTGARSARAPPKEAEGGTSGGSHSGGSSGTAARPPVARASSGGDAGRPPTGKGAGQPSDSKGSSKIGPNDRCPCGSGKKYKKCHGTSSG